MRAPWWWARDGLLPRLLDPFGRLYAMATARRVKRPGWRAPVPVICIGNASAGGTGKTTVALDIAARLAARGATPGFLTRGYGGSGDVRRVELRKDSAADVGDEPLLLAATAPTYIGADRVASAQLAVDWGARSLVMDDGLQNPGLIKDLSFLVIDGAAGFGNGRVIPAGPLREPAAVAAARCQAAIIIGEDVHNVAAHLTIPVLRARLRSPEEVKGRRLYAFAGIGRPEKFFAGLTDAGAELAGTRGFPDHHRYTTREFEAVLAEASRRGAEAATTPKDAARLTQAQRARVRVVGVSLDWQDPAGLDALLAFVVRRTQ